jgi:hypothetical protein
VDHRSYFYYALFSLPTVAFSWWLSGNLLGWLRAPKGAEDQMWSSLAEGLFEQHGEAESLSAEKRIQTILNAGMKRLELRSAFLFLHTEEKSRIVGSASIAYAAKKALQLGAELKRGQTYCSLLSEQRRTIAIDAASLSEWRRHHACQEFGWESYLGVFIPLEQGLSASLVFADSHPRDKLYSMAEKEFISGLASWCGALLFTEVSAAKRAENSQAVKSNVGIA